MNPAATPNREKALTEWYTVQTLRAANVAQYAAETEIENRQWLEDEFGDAEFIAHLAAEGVRARVCEHEETRRSLEIEFACPGCGRLTWSRSIYSWSYLGEMLEQPPF